jgi:hypothetical protein
VPLLPQSLVLGSSWDVILIDRVEASRCPKFKQYILQSNQVYIYIYHFMVKRPYCPCFHLSDVFDLKKPLTCH